MNLDDLRNANFSNLDKAVSEWDSMASKLYTFSSDVRTDVKGKSDKADWTGVNATVTREFIQQTATECDDMASSARSIHAILSGAASALKTYQTDLTERIAQDSKDCYVRDNGNGTFTVEVRDDAAEGSDGKAETLKTDIEQILRDATNKDKSTAETLDALAKLTDKGFSGVTYASEDEAAEALEDADRAAELGEIDPMEMTPEQFDELNGLMGEHRDDPLFAERFATTLGPKNTLDLWAGLNDINSPLAMERHDKYAAFQENLSLTLATASHSDSDAMTRWKWDMVDASGERVGGTRQPHGFQVMSNLMRVGDYDDQFLNSYGTALINKEKELTNNGEWDHRYWTSGGMNGRLNYMGGDVAGNGLDPFVGFMKGLSNSPDASTEFFNGTFVTKDEDHEFENGDGDKRELSNFDYLFEEREWPESMHLEGGSNNDHSYNALGEALEAATTGHPAGEAPTADLPPHNEDQASLMEDIVTSVSEEPKRLTDHDMMSDSMGRMTAEYLPDFNRSMSDDGEHGNIDKLFPIAGSAAEMDSPEATRFLVAVGQDPEGYAAVELGQKTYAANLMDYHLNPDLPEDQRYSDDPQDVVETISRRSGEIGGTLALGRQEAVIGPAEEDDNAFNHALAQGKNVVSGAVGIGVGVGTTFVASPVGGVVAGGTAATATSVILDEIVKTAEQNSSGEAMSEAGPMWEESKENNINLTQQSANMSAEYHQIDDADEAADWARTGTLTGFTDAESNANRVAADMLTEVE